MISVVIPTYNRFDLLKEAIKSCKNCNHVSEIIVIDDGSTDQSYGMLKHVYANEPSIIIHQYTSNQGSPRCYNKGIDLCNNAYVSFLGDDDEFCKDRFHSAYNLLTRDSTIDVVVESVFSYDINLSQRIPSKDIRVPNNFVGNILPTLLTKNEYHLSLEGMTIRRSFIANTRFDEDLKISQDTDFIWELCKSARVVSTDYSHSLVKRRIHNTNITKNKTELYRCREILFRKWYRKSLVEKDLRDYRWHFFRHYAHWKAVNQHGLEATAIDKVRAYYQVASETLKLRR